MATPVKLKFKIVYSSSEDPDHPVMELLDPSINSWGWLSDRYCEYPQEIIVQFTQIIHLKQLQFLSHQSKISKRIEILTFNPHETPQS